MGTRAWFGTEPAANGMRRKGAAEALHLRASDESDGSPPQPVDDFLERRLVQRMSRRSRHAHSALNQPDLFGLPQLVARHEAASARCEPRVIDQRTVPESEPQKQQPPVGRAIQSERRPSREALSTPVHLLDVRAAAAWLGLSKSTLDKMRCYGVGPRFIRATGRAVRYDPADLAAFAEGRRQSRTSDEVPA